MERTIEEILQQAFVIHDEGNVQEDELLCRVVLQPQPAHPNETYKLRLIAISRNQGLSGGEKSGVVGQRLDLLREQSPVGNESKVLCQAQPNSLLEPYQNVRVDHDEKLAVSTTEEFPEHLFGWKKLDIVLGQSCRNSDVFNAQNYFFG